MHPEMSTGSATFNHMDMEKTMLLVYELIYWINISTDIEMPLEIAPYVLIFR